MPKGEHLKRIPKETRLKNLGVKPLGPGEASQLLQVRGAEEVVHALKALTPEERGRVAGLGLEALKRGVEDPEALAQALEAAPLGRVATEAGVRDPGDLRQALEELEAFRELWGRLPGAVRWILARVWGRGGLPVLKQV